MYLIDIILYKKLITIFNNNKKNLSINDFKNVKNFITSPNVKYRYYTTKKSANNKTENNRNNKIDQNSINRLMKSSHITNRNISEKY